MGGDERYILEELLAAQTRREPVALAVIVRDQGSVPRHAGSKILVLPDGRTLGSVGGGELEARVVAAAKEAMIDGRPRVVPFSLVEPQRGDPGVCGGNVDVYIEPFLSPATLFVVGCGHVGKALASLGHWLGYRVICWDDRPELVGPDNVPEADHRLSGPITDALVQQPIDNHTYVAVVTRNVTLDRGILPPLLNTPAAFLGVMGSRRRWEETKRQLIEDGMAPERLGLVYAPIGLELNAESPEEIAVSIMAQITMLRRHGTGVPMAIGNMSADMTGS